MWTNCYHDYSAHAAFGGYKKSGIDREIHKMMLEHYRQTKNCRRPGSGFSRSVKRVCGRRGSRATVRWLTRVFSTSQGEVERSA